MSYWRKFVVVVLLALSLPIQSFATVSMPCAGVVAPHAEDAAHTMPVAQDGHRDHGGHARHAPACSACVSCCFGTGMSGVPAVPAAADVRVAILSPPLSAVMVSFLTGGIDRPPRGPLV
ncbi:hypothetical protein B7G54_31375 [Burkholderia puraquae]|uniref:DUF2946 domain-containing protein n=1 Tax=Burkholderia puraquae TaxID=1904757 RepID=A0A1X1P8I2_9BURK|nr:hypothetical protein [Burkholderia puraquae]ORT81539.1 hypothetical protein B7G54_31375 [Burkholderia puraquae]CAB3749910.1 hypothetical protein LMG29660_01090 [Burkholderia puraquae]